MVVHEIKDFGELAKGEHKEIVTSALKEAVAKVRIGHLKYPKF